MVVEKPNQEYKDLADSQNDAQRNVTQTYKHETISSSWIPGLSKIQKGGMSARGHLWECAIWGVHGPSLSITQALQLSKEAVMMGSEKIPSTGGQDWPHPRGCYTAT